MSFNPVTIFMAIVDAITGMLGLKSSNSLAQAIQILAAAPMADINAGWFRDILGAILGITFLMTFASTIYHGITAVRANDLAPFVESLLHAVRVLICAPFIILGVLLLQTLSHFLVEISVAVATVGSTPANWQKVLVSFNPAGHLTMSGLMYVLGFLLMLYVIPMQQAVYLYTILFTLALGVGIGADKNGLLYRWTYALLMMSIFSQPLMVFIMAVGGNIMGHISTGTPVDMGSVIWVVLLAAAVPTVLFFVFTHSLKKRQKAAKAVIKAEAEAAKNQPVGAANGSGDQQYMRNLTRPNRDHHAAGKRAAARLAEDAGVGLAAGAIAARIVAATPMPPQAKIVLTVTVRAVHKYLRVRHDTKRG